MATVIAHHESGRVPARHADAVRALSKTHRIALVSNIWSPKQHWLDELDRAGLTNAFSAMVFSSDTSYLVCTCPCQRFAVHLAAHDA